MFKKVSILTCFEYFLDCLQTNLTKNRNTKISNTFQIMRFYAPSF